MVPAMTMTRIHPKNQQDPMDIKIPCGTARVALLASSDIWTQESKAPMVHRLLIQLIMNAQPVGQVVRLAVSVKI